MTDPYAEERVAEERKREIDVRAETTAQKLAADFGARLAAAAENPKAIRFTVYGEPVAQGRARAAMIAGHVRMYDPAKSRSYKERVYYAALEVKPPVPLECPVSLTVKAFRSIPKGFSKAKRQAALAGRLRPTTKPDLKNVLAGVEDSLKGVIWKDDSQVIDFGESGKWYSDEPRVEVIITPVGE